MTFTESNTVEQLVLDAVAEGAEKEQSPGAARPGRVGLTMSAKVQPG